MSSLTKPESHPTSITQHFTSEQLAVLKQQIAPKCSNTELDYFIEVCKQTNLSPFTREIYAISREVWNSETRQKEPKMTIQVSIDGLRKRAANSGLYDGSATYWCGEDARWLEVWLKSTPPAAAKTVVYRKGCSQPFIGVARFDAYKQEFKNKSGAMEVSGLWAKMPDIMIGKCSEALALRKAFPEQTAGLYATEEMDQVSNPSPEGKTTQSAPTPPQKKQDTVQVKEAFKRMLSDRGVDLEFNGNGAFIGGELVKMGYKQSNGKGDANKIPIDKLEEVVDKIASSLESHNKQKNDEPKAHDPSPVQSDVAFDLDEANQYLSTLDTIAVPV